MRSAILTDLHANREAFQAVLADLEGRGIDRLVFLGDLVGYGPDPDWVLDRVETLVAKGALAVRGNHDRAVSAPDGAMNPAARRVIDWTVNRLNARQKLFLSDLPISVQDGDTLFVHASANDPQDWLYVTGSDRAMPSFRVSAARLIFVGHVHVPALYSEDRSGRVGAHDIPFGQPIPLVTSRRWLGVVGSVGQPRDGTGQASYCILDRSKNEITYRRVGYDAALTAKKSRAAGLPERLAQRLMQGF
jgi:predicted phosphodiesterase